MKDKQHLVLDDLLNRVMELEGFPHQDTGDKVDLLERVLERWRFENSRAENTVKLEEFVQHAVFVDPDKIVISKPPRIEYLGSGVPPIRLQPTLLMYLLAAHCEHAKVFEVINGYVARIRPNLSQLDFKKTKTGVTRCFTNTRFAANVLRDYGMLKFTGDEAYKTWVLSLPGFIVASKVFEQNDWGLKIVDKEQNFDLHPAIRSVWDSLDSFEKFVNQLVSVCNPNLEIFDTFRSVLSAAYRELDGYWQVLNDGGIAKKDRKRDSLERLKPMESLKGMDKFYKQFVTSVNVNKFVEAMKSAIQ